MDTQTCQIILNQLNHCQLEIDNARMVGKHTDYTLIIDTHTRFIEWYVQLQDGMTHIENHSRVLQTALNQGISCEQTLSRLEIAIDTLIRLQSEIKTSRAHLSEWMEGRYLAEHAAGACLDQLSNHIARCRHELAQHFPPRSKQTRTLSNLPTSLAILFSPGVELLAYTQWLENRQD